MPAACVSWVCSNRSLTVRCSPINSESEAIRPPIHPHLIYDAAAAARILCSMRIRRSRIQNGVGRGEGRHIKLRRRRHALPDRRGEWLTKRYLSIVSSLRCMAAFDVTF